MTKAYHVPGQPAVTSGLPAMTADQRRRWKRYRRALDELPHGIPAVCSGMVEAIAESDNGEKFTDGEEENGEAMD